MKTPELHSKRTKLAAAVAAGALTLSVAACQPSKSTAHVTCPKFPDVSPSALPDKTLANITVEAEASVILSNFANFCTMQASSHNTLELQENDDNGVTLTEIVPNSGGATQQQLVLNSASVASPNTIVGFQLATDVNIDQSGTARQTESSINVTLEGGKPNYWQVETMTKGTSPSPDYNTYRSDVKADQSVVISTMHDFQQRLLAINYGL